MKKFSIFLAILLGISMFAVTSCDSAESEVDKAVEEAVEAADKAVEDLKK